MLTVSQYSHAGLREKVEAVDRLPLPGADVQAGPSAGLTRCELEAAAEVLLLITRSVLDTPRDTPNPATAGDRPARGGTAKGRSAAACKRQNP